MVSTRHAKVEEPEPGSSTRSGKRPKETSPETAPLLAHEMLSAPSPVAGTPHGVVYTPQLYDGMAASSSSSDETRTPASSGGKVIADHSCEP